MLDSFRKASFILVSELWEDKFGSLLGLVKGFILDVLELRKVRLYGDNPSVQQTQSQIASGELKGVAGARRCLGGQKPHVHNYGMFVYGPSAVAAT